MLLQPVWGRVAATRCRIAPLLYGLNRWRSYHSKVFSSSQVSVLKRLLMVHREDEGQNEMGGGVLSRSTGLSNHLQRLDSLLEKYFATVEDLETLSLLLREGSKKSKQPSIDESQDSDYQKMKMTVERVEEDLVHELFTVYRHTKDEDYVNEHSPVFLECRPGVGGEEACLFANDIFHMYEFFAASRGWKFDIIDTHLSALKGYKSAIARIEGEWSLHALQHEAGVHRVQRVAVTSKNSKVHTSSACVEVIPERSEITVTIKPSDVRMETMRASGPGGQSVNTSETAVKLTHLATGIVIHEQDRANQGINRDTAFRKLQNKLMHMEMKKQEEKISKIRQGQIGSRDRSAKIRTYNFPKDIVVDHRLNKEFAGVETFLKSGDGVEYFIKDLDQRERLSNLLKLFDRLAYKI